MNKPDLAGRRILVVEDEYFLSIEICAQIEEYGGVVLGPVPTLEDGRALLQAGPQPDGSILDIRLRDQLVYPLADSLIEADVPIIFASDASKGAIPDEYATVPLLSKPINMMRVAEQLFPAP